MEWTGTNRPRAYTPPKNVGTTSTRDSHPLSGSQVLDRARPGACSEELPDDRAAVMAAGKRPVPSRTRKLSPPAPMVLPGGPGGRVGHRRAHSRELAPDHRSGANFVVPVVRRPRAPTAPGRPRVWDFAWWTIARAAVPVAGLPRGNWLEG